MNALIPRVQSFTSFSFVGNNVMDNHTTAAVNNSKTKMKLLISPGKEKLYQAAIFSGLPKQKNFTKKMLKLLPHRDIHLSTNLLRCLFTDENTPPFCLPSASSVKSLRRSFSRVSSHLDRFNCNKCTKDAHRKWTIDWRKRTRKLFNLTWYSSISFSYCSNLPRRLSSSRATFSWWGSCCSFPCATRSLYHVYGPKGTKVDNHLAPAARKEHQIIHDYNQCINVFLQIMGWNCALQML